MALFIFLLIVFVLALGVGFYALGRYKWIPLGGFTVAVLAFIGIIAMSTTQVPARSVGVEVTFGKTTNAFDSGLHFKKPWSKVVKFQSTIQTVRFERAQDKTNASEKQNGDCLVLHLSTQTTACVDMTVQWQVNTADKKAVENLYSSWRSFEHIQPNLIEPQIKHSVIDPFETFNPFAGLAISNNADPTQQPAGAALSTQKLADAAKSELQRTIGDGITVTNFTINLVNYDQATQDKINGLASEQGNTRIAVQSEQTAAAQAAANNALAASGGNNTGVLYQNCLNVTNNLVKDGKALPAAWNCGAPPESVVNVNK